jgi:hypothetical protein
MNKEDALNKLDQLEAEAKALREIIEAADKPPVPTRWKPRDGENYYQVTLSGEVRGFCATLLLPEEYRHGNCFHTREHADIAAEAVSRTLKTVACALEVDPNAGELHKTQRRWTVIKDITTCKWEVTWSVHVQIAPIYVHTNEQAKQLAAMLNAEGV